jgi:hypothetical protein
MNNIVLAHGGGLWMGGRGWRLIATGDKGIPPGAQRPMSKRASSKVVEVKGSHAVPI